MALSWTVTKVGSGSIIDKRAALRLIREENAKRTAQNVILAAQTPPGTPLAMLPFATNNQIETSVETLMGAKLTSWWDTYKAEASRPEALKERLTDEQFTNLTTAAIDRMDAGTTPEQLATDLSS